MLLIISFLACIQLAYNFPESACPRVFEYKENYATGVGYGEITLPYRGERNLRLFVNMSLPDLIEDAKIHIKLASRPEDLVYANYIRFYVNFPLLRIVPRVVDVIFNGKIYCKARPERPFGRGITFIWSEYIYKGDPCVLKIETSENQPIEPERTTIPEVEAELYETVHPSAEPTTTEEIEATTSFIPSFAPQIDVKGSYKLNTEFCGYPSLGDEYVSSISGEELVNKAEFPWLVAIFHLSNGKLNYICSGNLITHKHVLTTANCLKDKPISKLILMLGIVALSSESEEEVFTIKKVWINPEHKTSDSAHADLAIILLDKPTTYKKNINPVCIWEKGPSLEPLVGTNGVVASWVKDNLTNGIDYSQPADKIRIPIVSEGECLRSNPGLLTMTSNTTFCAGVKEGNGHCTGDNGVGFMLEEKGRLYLRGIFSKSLAEIGICDFNSFAVFVDVAKYIDWIQQVVFYDNEEPPTASVQDNASLISS